MQDRKANLPSSWDDPIKRPAENYLYGHALVSEFEENPEIAILGVDIHALSKLFRIGTSPFSYEAMQAGREGVLDAASGKLPNCGCKK